MNGFMNDVKCNLVYYYEKWWYLLWSIKCLQDIFGKRNQLKYWIIMITFFINWDGNIISKFNTPFSCWVCLLHTELEMALIFYSTSPFIIDLSFSWNLLLLSFFWRVAILSCHILVVIISYLKEMIKILDFKSVYEYAEIKRLFK